MQTLLSQPNRLPDLTDDIREDLPGLRGSLLVGGLRLLLANKRLLLWLWLANFACGLLATLPFSGHIAGYLDHSLAAQQIAGRIDLGYIGELLHQAGKDGAISTAPPLLSIVLFALVSVVLAGGAIFVFVSGMPARFSVVAEAGVRYFWRFVRLNVVAAIMLGLTVWLLSTLRDAWLDHAEKTHLGAALFWRSLLSFGVIVFVALLVRFCFDLAEVVVVQMGIAGDRRVRRSAPVALALLRANFFRAFFSYFAAGLLGAALCALAVWFWIAALSPYWTAVAFLLGQLAIAMLLAGRLWQRAALSYLATFPSSTITSDLAESPVGDAAELRTIW